MPYLAPRMTSAVEVIAPFGATGWRLIMRSISSGRAKSPRMKGTRSILTNGSTVSLPPNDPMMPSSMPTNAAMIPLTMTPRLSTITIAMPMAPVAAISEKPNLSTNGRATGMAMTSSIAPKMPPSAETA